MSVCKACTHPRREELESALVQKAAMRAIAREFVLSKDCVRRHRAHIAPALDPLRAEIAPCPLHPSLPFYFVDGSWLCGGCNAWDGSLAYWRAASATVTRTEAAGAVDVSRADVTQDGQSHGPEGATQ